MGTERLLKFLSRQRSSSTRAASPMQSATANGAPPSGGFTAVNGARTTSFRPSSTSAAAAKADGPRAASEEEDNIVVRMKSPSAPPADARDPQPTNGDLSASDANASHKRKRSDSTRVENVASVPPAADEAPAPAPAPAVTPSAAAAPALLSSSKPLSPQNAPAEAAARSPRPEERASATLGHPMEMSRTHERAPSPVPNTEVKHSPGEPRKDITAMLAETVKREFGHGSDRAASSPPDEDDEDDDDDAGATEDGQPDGAPDAKKRKRQFSNRTKTGCHTCRSRKKKCDEGKPHCENCRRGNFECTGYGPKPSMIRLKQAIRSNVPINAPQHVFEGTPAGYAPHPHEPPRGYWSPHTPPEPPGPPRFGAHPPPPMDPRAAGNHEGWARQGPPPSWGPPDQYAPPYGAGRPPLEYPPPPSHGYPPDPRHHQAGPPPSGPPPPHHSEPWAAPPPGAHPPPGYRLAPGPHSVGHDSSSSGSGSHRSLALAAHWLHRGEVTERTKMITGQPYRHFTDGLLLGDRDSCMRAVRDYNLSAQEFPSAEAATRRERLFRAIIHPPAREHPPFGRQEWLGPMGNVGSCTIVESPFLCDYGYNLVLGNDVAISPGCHLQDACRIEIGHGTILGPNVKCYTMTASVCAAKRGGSGGTYLAGAIKIEENCLIGADATILAYRTIGKGSVVAAGSVVTRDVPPYTLVAGNPAKRVRDLVPGATDDRSSRRDIQEQNDAMIRAMQNAFYGDEPHPPPPSLGPPPLGPPSHGPPSHGPPTHGPPSHGPPPRSTPGYSAPPPPHDPRGPPPPHDSRGPPDLRGPPPSGPPPRHSRGPPPPQQQPQPPPQQTLSPPGPSPRLSHGGPPPPVRR